MLLMESAWIRAFFINKILLFPQYPHIICWTVKLEDNQGRLRECCLVLSFMCALSLKPYSFI